MVNEITITQARKAEVDLAKKAGYTVYDVTRGNASVPSYTPAIRSLILELDELIKEGKPSPYGEHPLGEPRLKQKALEGILQNYPYDELDINRVGLFPGAQFGIVSIFTAIIQEQVSKGNQAPQILIQWPGYPNYQKLFEEAKKLAGCPEASIRHIPVNDKGYVGDNALQPVISNNTAAVLLTIPSNPQGTITPKEEMQKIAKTLSATGAHVIIDESFMEIDFRKDSAERFRSITDIANVSEQFLDRSFIIRSGTKAAAMASFRPSMVMLPKNEEIINSVTATAAKFLGNTGMAEQILMAEWINSLDISHQEKISDHYQQNLSVITDTLDKLKVPYIKPDGGFFISVNFKELIGKNNIKNDEDIYKLFLKDGHDNGKEKLGIMPGSDFGFHAEEGWGRLCFGGSKENVVGASRVITNVYNRFRENEITKVTEPEFEQAKKTIPITRKTYLAAASIITAVGIALGIYNNKTPEKAATYVEWNSEDSTDRFLKNNISNSSELKKLFGDTVKVNGIDVPIETFSQTIAPALKSLKPEDLSVVDMPKSTIILYGDNKDNNYGNASLGNYVELVKKQKEESLKSEKQI